MFDKYNCKIYFSYDVDKTEIYQIIVKIYDSKTDCPKPVNVVLITVLVFVILLVIGAVLIGLYFLSLYLYYRADYQNFEKETRKNSGQGKANPLYQPMTNVDNPMNDFTKN
uniref:Integrin beta-6 (Trinotate prediction) n=1 Tax=Henneguya salminicola TaxID=69463 RepID=A0A6G3MF25_HENSL